MYVVEMLLGKDSGGSTTVKAPDWPQIEESIRDMDAKGNVVIGLFAENGDYFQIGGSSGVFVMGCRIGEHLHVAYDSSLSESNLLRVYEGQAADYPENECFDSERVVQAAKPFATTGALADCVEWKKY